MEKLKISIVSLLFSLLCCSSQASAVDVYGFGSYWDKGNIDGSGGVGIGVSLPFIIDALRIDGRAHYFADSDYGRGDITVTPFDLGLQLHMMPEGTFDPYVLGGISYNYIDASHISLDSKFGGYLGAGLDIELGTSLFKLFGEVMYRYSDIDNIDDYDLNANGMSANIGLKVHFF